MKRTILAVTVAALLGAMPASAQLDFSRFVTLGDSTTHGFTHGGVVDCYQSNAWPSVVARQAGAADFQIPTVTQPGIPPIFELAGFSPEGLPILQPSGDLPGLPSNPLLPRPYNNLGITGANTYDLLFQTGDISNLQQGDFSNVMFDIVLRFPQTEGPTGPIDATAIVQAIGLQPTFVTLWIGNNDALGAVLAATPIDGVTLTPADTFAALYQQALGALATQTDAQIVAFTVLDVADTIPFVTTLPPFINVPGFGVVPIMGSNGPLSPDSLVTLPAGALLAQGYGVPLPDFPPLPEDLDLATGEPGYVLRPDEVAAISGRIQEFNAIIRETAASFGVPVFDVDALLREAFEGLTYGGIELNLDFLTGGVVGYDGIHTQQLGDALLAAELIEFLNAEFNAGIPNIELYDYLVDNPCADLTSVATSKEAVFSREAHMQLIRTLTPHLARQLQREEPSATE